MNNLKNVAVTMVAALFLVGMGALGSYIPLKTHFKADLARFKASVVQDTIKDTIRVVEPKERLVRILDTIAIYRTDTITDTIYLAREQKVYEDSTYRAVVSGVFPSLDSIQIYNRTIIKTYPIKEYRKLDYGLQVGVGIVSPIGSSPSLGGYIGFGITYHF